MIKKLTILGIPLGKITEDELIFFGYPILSCVQGNFFIKVFFFKHEIFCLSTITKTDETNQYSDEIVDKIEREMLELHTFRILKNRSSVSYGKRNPQ